MLNESLKGWLDSLQAEALRKSGTHPLWKQIAVRFDSEVGPQARGKFAAELTIQGEERAIAETIVKQSLNDSIRLVMWLAAALALAASICAALTIRPQRRSSTQTVSPASG